MSDNIIQLNEGLIKQELKGGIFDVRKARYTNNKKAR